MTADELFDQFTAGFPKRKFSAGLLVAYIDFFTELDVPSLGVTSFADFLTHFPRQSQTSGGQRANTLIVMRPTGKTLSLRPFYNEAEKFYRAEHKRFDYPSAAPHATQAWADYPAWLDTLVGLDAAQLATLRDKVNAFVLATLPSQHFDPASVEIEPPLFRLLLEGFDMTSRKGEPSGASFQGIVFGFLRADNPHLQIEIEKVRTGSKRLQRVGDVDGWEGQRLAISAEVKQFELQGTDLPDLEAFANATGVRGSLAVIAALGFADTVRPALEGMGLIPLDVNDMLRIVELWDPIKQRTAVASFVYYATHIEKNSSLKKRINDFLDKADADWRSAIGTP
ncbi:hypothetical protein [Pseudohoeflea coraliihabitans]|uniref:Restriction endonuclease n=1 Tax=Pseudohoeflea coraliihabitans TaxID=2860393 RepID=A0ABS6WTH2_9HYPH|nr:hypothetical protein [Pseudohoeflea sp. DP4N28-3]MBW3099263.1 hypothetical protein [Pseudohoeflea sp. DP4N28-3]